MVRPEYDRQFSDELLRRVAAKDWDSEYEDHESRHSKALSLFLLVLERLVPEVVESLRNDVMPVYEAFCDGLPRLEADVWLEKINSVKKEDPKRKVHSDSEVIIYQLERGAAEVIHVDDFKVAAYQHRRRGWKLRAEDLSVGGPLDWPDARRESMKLNDFEDSDLQPLKVALEAWAERFHIADPSIFRNTLFALEWWRVGLVDDRSIFGYYSAGYGTSAPMQDQFSFRAWHPAFETAKAYKARHAEALNHYMNDCVHLVESADGHRRSKTHRHTLQKPALSTNEPSSARLHHMEWFVLFQVCERSYKSIADEVGIAPKSVEDAVKEVSRLLDIKLRPGRRGPRRSATS